MGENSLFEEFKVYYADIYNEFKEFVD